MKSYLTSAAKRRIIREVQQILREHPRYSADSENVQNKFSFKERPRRGVIVNSTSADRVRLAADNFVGRLTSFVMLAPWENCPGTTIEWVRENFTVLEGVSKRRDVFPSPPGVYLISVASLPDDARETPGTFYVDPILTVHKDPVLRFTHSAVQDAQLPHEDVYPDSLRLWLDGRQVLIPEVDYHADFATGHVVFLKPTPAGTALYADYRHRSPRLGPFPFHRDSFNDTAIPGAVLAFGDRPQLGDKLAVVTTDTRTETSDIYGGKFEIQFELVAFSRDAEDRERLAEYVVTKILERQGALGFEGIELLDVAPGGETEDIAIEGTDEYYYDTSISLSIRADWETYVPLPFVMHRYEFTSKDEETAHGRMDGTYPINLLRSGTSSSLNAIPLVFGKDLSYERIS